VTLDGWRGGEQPLDTNCQIVVFGQERRHQRGSSCSDAQASDLHQGAGKRDHTAAIICHCYIVGCVFHELRPAAFQSWKSAAERYDVGSQKQQKAFEIIG
jgi:hypothetical protein